jgi:RimJ/RimL family protein N-acetyltransferase
MIVYLETPRLILRRLTEADLGELHALDSDPEVMRYLGGRLTPLDDIRDMALPKMLSYYEEGPDYGFWAAVAPDTHEFLGWFHFRPPFDPVQGMELGYRLKRSAWGRGLATEGSRAIVRKGFEELGLERIIAKTLTVNLASRRVMEKLGMRHVDTFMEHRIDPPQEAVWYALDRSEFVTGR